jgi:hypothetical protein
MVVIFTCCLLQLPMLSVAIAPMLQDTTFHACLHSPFVLMVDESYSGKMHLKETPLLLHKPNLEKNWCMSTSFTLYLKQNLILFLS